MDGGRVVNNLVLLSDKNYPTWRIQLKMHLMKDELLSIVEGTEEAPIGKDNEAARKKFDIRRNKALATIVLAIDPKLLYLIGDPIDPVVVWQKLQDVFQKKTWANKLRLRKKLYNI